MSKLIKSLSVLLAMSLTSTVTATNNDKEDRIANWLDRTSSSSVSSISMSDAFEGIGVNVIKTVKQYGINLDFKIMKNKEFSRIGLLVVGK